MRGAVMLRCLMKSESKPFCVRGYFTLLEMMVGALGENGSLAPHRSVTDAKVKENNKVDLNFVYDLHHNEMTWFQGREIPFKLLMNAEY